MNNQIFDLTDSITADRLRKAENRHYAEKKLARRKTRFSSLPQNAIHVVQHLTKKPRSITPELVN
jgi:hypothetical protein